MEQIDIVKIHFLIHSIRKKIQQSPPGTQNLFVITETDKELNYPKDGRES